MFPSWRWRCKLWNQRRMLQNSTMWRYFQFTNCHLLMTLCTCCSFFLPNLSLLLSLSHKHTHTPRKHMHFFQLVITQLSYFCLDITSYREMTRTPVSSYVLLLASIAASYTPIITHNTLYGDRLNTFLYLLIDDKLCESRNSIYCAPSP